MLEQVALPFDFLLNSVIRPMTGLVFIIGTTVFRRHENVQFQKRNEIGLKFSMGAGQSIPTGHEENKRSEKLF